MDAFYALAEPRRRKILEILAANGQLSATQIYKKFKISPQAVSQHLKILLETRLLVMQKNAQRHIYQINPDSIFEFEMWAKQITLQWNQRLDRLDDVLKMER